MTDHDSGELPVGGSEEVAGISVIDLLKQDMADIAHNRDVYIPVKGYERTGLAVRYRMTESGKELDAIVEKVNRQDKDDYYRNLNAGMDTMIKLCLGIYVKPGDIEEWVELDPEEVGEPVKFDHRMAKILGMSDPENASARQVVKKLFNNNELAINDHAGRLQRWLADTKSDVNKELWQLGN